jgi:hypothetical protein
MSHSLVPHPGTPCQAVRDMHVTVERRLDRLALRYLVSGRIGRIALPEPSAVRRSDGLWRTTCFEAFTMSTAPGYSEFNLSPSLSWAAYRFDDYRSGMAALDIPAPIIAVEKTPAQLIAAAELRLSHFGAIRLGLSAVIETTDGAKSYWALAHPPGPPDFHHRDCFALELPPPRSP